MRRRVRSTGFLSRGRSTGPFRTWQAERRGDDAQGEGMERVLRAGRHEQAGGGALLPPPALQIQSPAARKECPPCCLPALLPPPPPPPLTQHPPALCWAQSRSASPGGRTTRPGWRSAANSGGGAREFVCQLVKPDARAAPALTAFPSPRPPHTPPLPCHLLLALSPPPPRSLSCPPSSA